MKPLNLALLIHGFFRPEGGRKLAGGANHRNTVTITNRPGRGGGALVIPAPLPGRFRWRRRSGGSAPLHHRLISVGPPGHSPHSRHSIVRLIIFLLALCACARAQNFDRLNAEQRQRVERGFKMLDANADAKVTRDEFAKLGDFLPQVKDASRTDALFKMLDKNADASLTLEEYAGIMLLKPANPAPTPEPKPAPAPVKSAARSTVAPTAEGLAFFEKKIRSVLADKCYKCHAADSEKIKGGLVLDTRAGIRTGGDTGPAVVPGDLAKSLLIEAVRYANKDMQMPPEKSGGKLPDAVIADFEQWVKRGAPDPREGKAAVVKSSYDPTKAKDHWAFKAPQRQPAPAVKDAAWPRTDLDRFVLAALEEKGLKPVADAEPRSLVRRIYFDLIGLPPTPEEVEAFVHDSHPSHSSHRSHERDARNESYERLIDRLLDSPRFGERWGRHWLDVARYAESTGRDVNATLPHAWRYRDYVIAAFNADKPFDQFIREQIAGDLLPAKDSPERAGKLIATGFLAFGSRSLNEKNSKQFALDLADEQIDAMSQAMLGLTVACARCHDHKFDPIPQRDYYALAGIFLSTETRYGTAPTFEQARPGGLLALPADCGLPRVARKLSADERAKKERELAESRNLSAQMFAATYAGAKPGAVNLNNDPKKFVQVVALNARIRQIEMELGSFDADGNPKFLAMGARDLPPSGTPAERTVPRNFTDLMEIFSARPPELARIGDSPLFARGDVAKPGEKIARGFIGIVGKAPAIPANESGRRELAEWLVAKENPLTARVFVNRVWHWLFGRGLVESVDNFGTMGQPPSNQALLDHLALAFQDGGWSVKKLIREIVLSRAYQLDSVHDEKCFTADPEDALVWRMNPRRLDAECIRDAMLAVSGALKTEPPVGSAIALAGDGSLSGRQIRGLREPLSDEAFLSAAGDFRSVYLPVPRNAVPDALAVFDFAEANTVAGARDTTTVPGQALWLLNSEFVAAQSRRFAGRLLALPAPQRLDKAFRSVFARPPTVAEKIAAQKLFDRFPGDENAAWTSFCRALFSSAEFRILN